MRRFVATTLSFAVLLAGLALFGCKEQGPTGKAVGTVQRSAELIELEKSMWQSLAPFQEQFLQSYSSQLASMPDDPLALMKAFDELMYAVSGPSGLWRAHVPKQYFGCTANHELPICQQFEKLEMSFLPWETLHVQISSLSSPQEAALFIEQYGPKLKKYIAYYVPKGKTLEAVQATPFFKDQLSMFLTQ